MMNTRPEKILQQKGIKITANRLLILEVFLQRDYALRLADVEEALPWADRTTIFRTLKTFEQEALIHLIDDGGKANKYALCSQHCQAGKHAVHPHFHCNRCDKTLCLNESEVAIAGLPESYAIQDISVVIKGLCQTCNVTS